MAVLAERRQGDEFTLAALGDESVEPLARVFLPEEAVVLAVQPERRNPGCRAVGRERLFQPVGAAGVARPVLRIAAAAAREIHGRDDAGNAHRRQGQRGGAAERLADDQAPPGIHERQAACVFDDRQPLPRSRFKDTRIIRGRAIAGILDVLAAADAIADPGRHEHHEPLGDEITGVLRIPHAPVLRPVRRSSVIEQKKGGARSVLVAKNGHGDLLRHFLAEDVPGLHGNRDHLFENPRRAFRRRRQQQPQEKRRAAYPCRIVPSHCRILRWGSGPAF